MLEKFAFRLNTESKPSSLWHARCADALHDSSVMSAPALAAHVKDFPA
ncbi:hypothetical protein [Streptomyces sp. MS1.AVA.4]|uniref:Uncharacterized protein n=1 Tax=Streptomyces pratisoli TaxID=3139917 RepID=A0ACC6Q9J9_9ACTN